MKIFNPRVKATWPLALVVLLNYAAQVPYYLHQYYFPHHLAPSLVGMVLLGLTLVWFLVGYGTFVFRKPYGLAVLLGFLAAQIVFYGYLILFGLLTGAGAVAQLSTSSPVLFVIFAIGYLNFAVAVYYAVWLIVRRKRLAEAPRR